MGYYDMMLDKEIHKLCIIVKFWVKYMYQGLSIGVSISLYVFQDKIWILFHYMIHYCVHMENLVVFINDMFENHVDILYYFLNWLEISWMQVNAVICKWEHNSFVYLALLVILDRIKMKPSAVKSIMWTEPTKTKHEIRLFIGVINFYHYLWKKLFYMLYPLRKLLG